MAVTNKDVWREWVHRSFAYNTAAPSVYASGALTGALNTTATLGNPCKCAMRLTCKGGETIAVSMKVKVNSGVGQLYAGTTSAGNDLSRIEVSGGRAEIGRA